MVAATYLLEPGFTPQAVAGCVAVVAMAADLPPPQPAGECQIWYDRGERIAEQADDPDTGPYLAMITPLPLVDLDRIVTALLPVRDRAALLRQALEDPAIMPAAALASRHDPSRDLLLRIVDMLEGAPESVEPGLKALAWLAEPAFAPALRTVAARVDLPLRLRDAAQWLAENDR